MASADGADRMQKWRRNIPAIGYGNNMLQMHMAEESKYTISD